MPLLGARTQPLDVQDAAQAGANADLVEAQGFTGFVDQHGDAVLHGATAQRAVAYRGIQDHRCAERPGQAGGLFVQQRSADLRQVFAVHGAGVQVDAAV